MSKVRLPVALVVLAVLAVAVAAASLEAAQKSWKFLGERSVSDGADHDVIVVTAAEGDLRALQLRVKGHAVQFRSMTVRFGNGESHEIELRAVIPAGGASRVIDLPGGERVIQRVEFRYDAQAIRGHRAVVRLFGR